MGRFFALADAAIESGAEIAGFVAQAHFLINGGLQEELDGFVSCLPQSKSNCRDRPNYLPCPAKWAKASSASD